MREYILLFLTTVCLNVYSQNVSIVKIDSIEFKLPGESWKLVNKNPDAGQFLFQDKKNKISISLSARDKTKFEFYNVNLTDVELVNAFYKWDADYWKSNKDYDVYEIKKDEAKKYIIWKIEVKSKKIENYFLSGIKSNYLIGLNIPQIKQKLEQEKQIQLLENVFLN